MRPRSWLGLVVVAALAFTLLVSVTSVVDFAYRTPGEGAEIVLLLQ